MAKLSEQTSTERSKSKNNMLIAASCLMFFAGMIAMAYASVPLYKIFCQVTGYGGTTRRAELASATILDKTINVRFDSNMGDSALGWKFKPLQREVTIKIGESKQVEFEATNTLDYATTGTATFNVTPQAAGAYFNKIQCFCFTEQTLQAGETAIMPVVFFVDPDIAEAFETKDIATITLSYTFYKVDEPANLSSIAPTETVVPQVPLNGDDKSNVAGNRG